MFFSRNWVCIIRLATKNFKTAKVRNVITILAMVLTTILFTSMVTICIGSYESVQTTIQMQKGSKADGDIRYMTEEQFTQLQKQKDIKMNGCRRPVGFAANTKGHNVEIDYMDKTEQELTFNKPTYGKTPEKANEIATTDKALESLGVKPQVGEKFTLELELRGVTYTYEMVVSGWWEAINPQVSVLLVSEDFMEENEDIFPYTYDEDKEYAGTYFSDIVFQSRADVESQIDALVDGFNTKSGEEIVVGALNSVTNPDIDFSTIFVAVVFILLFGLVGYLLINNIYSISIMQDVRCYGLLKTIGTTQRLITLLVRIQALWSLLISIPVGLLIGYWIGKGILPLVLNFMSSEYTEIGIVVKPNILIFVAAALFTIITVGISIQNPLRIVRKISPLVAVKFVEESKEKNHKRTKRFSIIKMAKDNFERNTKKSVFIVISIALCCVLFNSALILANSISVEKATKLQSTVDVEIGSRNLFNNMEGFKQRDDGLNPDIIKLVSNNFQISEEGIIYKNTLDDLEITYDYGVGNTGEIVEEESSTIMIQDGRRLVIGNYNFPICNVYGIDENVYNRMEIIQSEEGMERSDLFQYMNQENMLIEAVPAPRDPKEEKDFQCDIGSTVKVYTSEGEKEYRVIAHAYVSPTEYEVPGMTTGVNSVGGDAPLFYLAQNHFLELYNEPTIMSYTFNVKGEKLSEFSSRLESFLEPYTDKVSFTSSEMLKNSMDSVKNMIYAVGIVISIIIGIAGLMNFLNLTIANIVNRRREFAIMEGVGMMQKQIRQLVTAEGLFYAVLAAAFGVVFSLIAGYCLILPISGGIWFMEFQMKIMPAITIAGTIIVLTGFLPRILLRIFGRGSIVERLRLED